MPTLTVCTTEAANGLVSPREVPVRGSAGVGDVFICIRTVGLLLALCSASPVRSR